MRASGETTPGASFLKRAGGKGLTRSHLRVKRLHLGRSFFLVLPQKGLLFSLVYSGMTANYRVALQSESQKEELPLKRTGQYPQRGMQLKCL